MFRILRQVGIAAFLVSMAAVVLMVTFAWGSDARPLEAATGRDRGCYPDNEFVLGTGGALSGSSRGRVLAEAEIEIPPSSSEIIDESARVDWRFTETVTGNVGSAYSLAPGSMTGKLSVKVDWTNTAWPDTEFKSDCIAEAQLDGGKIEAELEGTVLNFPGGSNAHKDGPTRAVATINVKPDEDDPSQVKFIVNIELGTTCFEELVVPPDSFSEFEFTVTGSGGGKLPVSSTTGEFGRAGLPAGFTPSDNPCAGVFF